MPQQYSPPCEDIQRKLELSRLEAQGLEKYIIRCPICNFPLEEIYGEKIGIVSIKCNKCKFCGPLNLAYFRRQRNHYRYYNFRKMNNPFH